MKKSLPPKRKFPPSTRDQGEHVVLTKDGLRVLSSEQKRTMILDATLSPEEKMEMARRLIKEFPRQ
jgi:hypothetical protein